MANQLEGDAKTTKGTENTLKARTMILIRQNSVLGTKRKIENIKEDICKQIRSSWQTD